MALEVAVAEGCTDASACNYDAGANMDDDGCSNTLKQATTATATA